MRLPLPMALDHVNIYALDDGDGWTLIDTGISSGRSRRIWAALLEGPLSAKPVHRVLVTHHHPDHIGLAGWFQAEHGAELLTTRTAWLFARMLMLDAQDTPLPETLAYWKSAGMAPQILAERAASRPFNFADVLAPMPLGYTRLDEDDVLDAGGRRWRVRLGHGHAPDHITLWDEDGEIVLAGDQLLPSISPNIGVYATEPEADPVADWMAATTRLSAFATERQLVLPGHKLPYRGLPTRMRQLHENHQGALARLEAYLDAPRSACDCFLPLFKREIRDGEYGLALVEAMAHVLHLWHAGRVRRTMTEDGIWLWQRTEP
ncbi:MAG: MBL fold metallo-hydrolase [Alphaproteobacteria bacterium]|nr:MBL fold metallo-hydrolase [Alphaproteobacteria bacterium]NNF23852.1 MBL fold metallo-hydrolase [Paracoccaceae bacterium]